MLHLPAHTRHPRPWQLFNLEDKFRAAVYEVTGQGPGPAMTSPRNFTLDRNARAHVFETTIRALGGLLSAHQLVTRVRCDASIWLLIVVAWFAL